MKVAILGSGISGLLAAWACQSSDVDYEVYSTDAAPPKPFGFTFLHSPCGIPLQPQTLIQIVVPPDVSVEEASKFYSKKVYGTNVIGSSLPYVFANPEIEIYNMSEAVKFLWNATHRKRKTFRDLDEVIRFSEGFDVTFSTIPIDRLDHDTHYFFVESFVEIRKFDAPCHNVVFYNGGVNAVAYRWGHLFGQYFEEKRERPGTPVRKVAFVKNMPEVPSNLILCGRYGAWDKSILSHNVYDMVLEKIDG